MCAFFANFKSLRNGPLGTISYFAIHLQNFAPGFKILKCIEVVKRFLAAAHVLDDLHRLVIEVLACLGVVEARLSCSGLGRLDGRHATEHLDSTCYVGYVRAAVNGDEQLSG